MLGIKETPSQVEMLSLTDFIRGSLGKYSPEDFKIAFTLYCENNLDENREHFQSFSALFVGRVMESYSRYRFKFIQKEETVPEVSEPQQLWIIENGCIAAFENYKLTKRLIDFGSSKYKYLEAIGLLNLTKERKDEIYKIAQNEHINELKSKTDSALTQKEAVMKGLFDLRDKGTIEVIKERARLIALREFFDNIIELEDDLMVMIYDLQNQK